MESEARFGPGDRVKVLMPDNKRYHVGSVVRIVEETGKVMVVLDNGARMVVSRILLAHLDD